jgi:thymidylate synthase (FAD)
MKVISPSVTLLHATPDPELVIERAGRTCYKSEDRITADSHVEFIRRLLDPAKPHESVLEHASAGFIIVCDRGISHELVRHRLASYSQESTRYCNYGKGKFSEEITVVQPSNISSLHEDASTVSLGKGAWTLAMQDSERAYLALLACGTKPQDARSVLPTCLKTEIVMTANFREWRHFLSLRLAPAAHPDMRVIAEMIRTELVVLAPTVFEPFGKEA